MGPKVGKWLVGGLVLLVGMTFASAAWAAPPAPAGNGGDHHRPPPHHPPPPPYGPHPCTVGVAVSPAQVGHGGTITVTLSGSCSDDTFIIVVYSSVRTLGSIATDAAGNGAGSFALPCAVNVGSHTVMAADAFGNSGAAFLQVTPAPCASAPGHRKGHQPPHQGGQPPHHGKGHGPGHRSDPRVLGVDAQAGVPIGAAAVGAAGLLLLGVRKRRLGHWS